MEGKRLDNKCARRIGEEKEGVEGWASKCRVFRDKVQNSRIIRDLVGVTGKKEALRRR